MRNKWNLLRLVVVFILVTCSVFNVLATAIAKEGQVVGCDFEEFDSLEETEFEQIDDSLYYPEGYIGYKYPVRPGMEEWSQLKNHQEMVDVCEIPEDVVASMSDEELAESVLMYPLSIDAFLYDTTTE